MTTKNADIPAMPQTHEDNLCRMTGMPKPLHSGLTKREMFAMAAMQGMLAHYGHDIGLAETCVHIADCLLDELSKENTDD
jgi:hypothetical protein